MAKKDNLFLYAGLAIAAWVVFSRRETVLYDGPANQREAEQKLVSVNEALRLADERVTEARLSESAAEQRAQGIIW